MRQLVLIALLANVALLTGCGGDVPSSDSSQMAPSVASNAATPATAGGGSRPTCVTAADVKEALGFEVEELTKGMRQYGDVWNCGFAATDASLPGVMITLTVESASKADELFAQMTTTIKRARGASAEVDPVALGNRGAAYGMSSRSMAAAVAGDRLYHVGVNYGAAGAGFGDRKAGAITLLRKLMGS